MSPALQKESLALAAEHEGRRDQPKPALEPVIDVERTLGRPNVVESLTAMASETGKTPIALMRDFVSLAFGPGGPSFDDYVKLRLFDESFYSGTDRRTLVGQKRNVELAVRINFRVDWMGIAAHKIAGPACLAAFGLPTVPLLALYAQAIAAPSPERLHNAAELARFLTDRDVYPLFGKPIDGMQSLGSLSLRTVNSNGDAVETISGESIPITQVVEEITSHYGGGYLFQPALQPHRDVAEICGPRLATVRLVTALIDGAPKVLGACWKLPSGRNWADNYWRKGNLLAALDRSTGRVLRAMSGTGLDLRGVDAHPDTGVPLVGQVVPGWPDLIALAKAAASTMTHLPLIGWDIAPTESGAVIIDMNEMPDLFLVQLADRVGALGSDLAGLLQTQKKSAQERKRMLRKEALHL